MIHIKPERGGFRINVVLLGRLQRTAWHSSKSVARLVATEFAAYYGKGTPLEIKQFRKCNSCEGHLEDGNKFYCVKCQEEGAFDA